MLDALLLGSHRLDAVCQREALWRLDREGICPAHQVTDGDSFHITGAPSVEGSGRVGLRGGELGLAGPEVLG